MVQTHVFLLQGQILQIEKEKKKKIKFEQISEVEASQTVELCLSQIKSGYNCYKVKLHIRFKARKKDKHHNNINTKKM